MAENDIIQNMILQLGQSRDDRFQKELAVHFADVDERSSEDLLLFTRKFSEYVQYYRDTTSVPIDDWKNFFPSDKSEIAELLNGNTAATPPHLALFIAFLELYRKPQEVINRITGRHLDFYYKEVLRFSKKAAKADRVHVLVELKKDSSPVEVSPEHLFSAGKDKTDVELRYAPARKTVVNTARVASLCSVFLDRSGHGTVRFAPIANSSDGLGSSLDSDEKSWYGFGHDKLPAAGIGFAIASPVLRMKEGVRTVTVTLTLNNADSSKFNAAALSGACDVFITGEEKWLGPYTVSPSLSAGSVLQFSFTVPSEEKAVVDYDAAIHGYAYAALAPVVHIVLKQESSTIGYADFIGVTLQKAGVHVDITGITSLTLESDEGALDPKKAFLPFGSQPAAGSRFMVGYAEALAKKLSEVGITVQWKDAPADFSSHYNGYGRSGVNNRHFTASVSFKDGGSWHNASHGAALFETGNASSEHTFRFRPGTSSVSAGITEDMTVFALGTAGSTWSRDSVNKFLLRKPVFAASRTTALKAREGFMVFSLEKDFLHAAYRTKYVENVITYSRTGGTLVIVNEPYTPAIQSISLSYKAHSDEVDIAAATLESFSNTDLHFFHIGCFGQMREHAYQREQVPVISDTNVPLLSAYTCEGELLIGFSSLKAGGSVNVLFQVAEGSADPDLEQENLDWSVLCDNYWKPLGTNEVALDATNGLRTSGVISFVIPPEATTHNTIMPTSYIWIKAAVQKNVHAFCKIIDVAANAMEARFIDNNNDPNHLQTALEKGKITKLKNGLSSVKAVTQPYASFGGSPEESGSAWYARVAERLRHKNRCISAWDYERIILEAFPNVHKVKCIPHAREDCWLAPGSVLIVVIPDLRNKNAADPLQPKVDADTISRITACVQERVSPQIKDRVKVKNPAYQRIQLDFKVKFRAGYEFNYYSTEANKALVRFLSPWACEQDRDISFGGIVYKSVLLDSVEELAYVDYVTDFKMYSYTEVAGGFQDISEARPATPDAILVSEKTHIIREA